MTETQEPTPGWTEALGEHAGNPPTPRTSGETISALGQDWTCSSCEQRIKAQFEQRIRARAFQAAVETEDLGGPEEGAKARSAYLADRAAGHYNWDGRYVRGALNDVPGVNYLLFLLLRRCHPDVTEAQAAAIFRDNPAGASLVIRWALGNSAAPYEAGPKAKGAKAPPTLDAA